MLRSNEIIVRHCGSGRKRGWWKAHCAVCERTCTDDRFMKQHTFKCSGCGEDGRAASFRGG